MTVAQNGPSGWRCRERDMSVGSSWCTSGPGARYLREAGRQRVAVARALVIEPPVLLLDEPLSNLDAKLREAMQFELRRIQRKLGTTTIMVTHDQAEALSISDRVVVMHNGRVQQIDAPHRLYEHPRSRFISGFVGKTNLCGRGRGVKLCGGPGLPRPPLAVADGSEITSGPRTGFADAAAARLPASSGRFFLGSQWLYRVSTALGELEVSCANDGREPWPEQADVHLAWSDDVARVLPAEATAA
jgi:putative spermidine/putrescine transport system ATP-binding protein